MNRSFLMIAVAGLILQAGCGRPKYSVSALSGTFWFSSGLPSSPTDFIPTPYTPMGALKLHEDGTCTVEWMMMDFVWKGTWTLSGSDLTVVMTEPEGLARPNETFLQLKVQDKDHLKMVGGYFAERQPVRILEREPVIPKKMQDDEKRYRAKDRARYIAETIKTFLDEKGEPLASTRAGLERQLDVHWDEEMFTGFKYTFKGGKVPKGKGAARTEIGRVYAPGGVAIAFADGHYEWRGPPGLIPPRG